jgi:hypothetical protein
MSAIRPSIEGTSTLVAGEGFAVVVATGLVVGAGNALPEPVGMLTDAEVEAELETATEPVSAA